MTKILFIAGDFVEDYELMVPYQACAPEVKLAGAEYADITVDEAITDGQFVTAPAWPANAQWVKQFVALF